MVNEEINDMAELYKYFLGIEKQYAGYALSILYLVKGTPDPASKLLDADIYKKDDSIKLMIEGIIEYNRSNRKEAKDYLSQSLAIDYSNQVAHLYTGIISLEDNDLGQARNHLMKAQAEDEYTSLYAITLLGDVLYKSGEKNTALLMWKKVLSMDSKYTPAWERVLNLQ